MGTTGWVILCLFGMAAAWLWKRHIAYQALGLGDGRKFGNQIAAAIGLDHNLFHTIFDSGDTPAPTLMMLNAMQRANLSPMDAAVEVAPFLLDGLHKLEDKWGPQPQLKSAQPVIHRLVGMYESKHQ